MFYVAFGFDHWPDGDGSTFNAGEKWGVYSNGHVPATDMRVLFEPWQEPSEPAPKLTTIGDIARKGVKPGTVVAVHLVVESTHDDDDIQPICLQTPDGDDFWPHRDTPCTIISEPEPEPWSPEPGKPALFLGHDVTIVAIDQASDEAWVRGGGVNGAVPLAELERPQ